MADEFPEIQDVADVADVEVEGSTPTDFLSREKELLGDEFATEQDGNIAHEDAEFEEFESSFPAVSSAPQYEQEEEVEEEKAEEIPVSSFGSLNLDESEPIKAWKERRTLEISKRDEVAKARAEELKDEAKKAIDDFYDNYSSKKDISIEETRKQEDAFLAKRDTFLERGTVWDRVVELLELTKNTNSVDTANHRDKTRFKELLLALKGKENVPGAAGY
ncbi:unnamed protein product [Kuraishia capsulata CBS 1993]|uniref:Clathrin light chain n=1 Tax=Kuraishia capsulata CBS 1993 TaxID=1382522 RepID=W6MF39_9ASCO|nr:uncharacterized protein KUCA_T00000179001 [Kuraishia capsulata CBS 1993]CDK24219.1 unnamed protein product [Kuraishia capsulata CBS 1993]